jgi:hypothetical protein
MPPRFQCLPLHAALRTLSDYDKMGIVIRRRRKELRLETQLESSVWRWLREFADISVDQFQTPWGIADLFAIKCDFDRVLARRDLGQNIASTNDQDLMVLLAIPELTSGKRTDVQRLEKEFSFLLGEAKVRSIVAALRRRKLIAVDSDGRICRNTPWLPFHKQMWAVELKLDRVDEALAQANRHLKITPYSYVGLPPLIAEKTANSRKAQDFRESGVGLLSISPEHCSTLIEPAGNYACVEPMYAVAAAERCWSTYLKTVQH